MRNSPKKIAVVTINKICVGLFETEREIPLTKEEVRKLIYEEISNAYTQLHEVGEVNSQNIKALYKELAIFLHPDKQFNTIHQYGVELWAYLGQDDMNLIDEPFKILKEIYEKESKKTDFTRFIEYIVRITKSMAKSYDRYYQPARFIVKSIDLCMCILVGIVLGVGVIGIVMVTITAAGTNGLINFTLNTLTSNQYNKELTALNMESSSQFVRLKLISYALYHAIKKPLLEVEGSKLLSVLLRPLQILAAPFILGAATLVEFTDFALTSLFQAGSTFCLLTLTATSALLNTPLYALDLCRYTRSRVKEWFYNTKKSDELVNINGSPRNLLMLEWHPTQSPAVDEKQPMQTGPFFSKFKPPEDTIPKPHSQSLRSFSANGF